MKTPTRANSYPQQFMLYMQVSHEQETERATKRLKTRVALARHSEHTLAQKQDHRMWDCEFSQKHDIANRLGRREGLRRISECNGTFGQYVRDSLQRTSEAIGVVVLLSSGYWNLGPRPRDAEINVGIDVRHSKGVHQSQTWGHSLWTLSAQLSLFTRLYGIAYHDLRW
jgi:hypothetical protein